MFEDPSGEVRLTIVAHSDFFAPGDQRADEEAFELQEAIRRGLPEHVRAAPAAGTKGVVSDVVIPLASSGALTATVELFKAWLGKRPDHRRIDVEYEVDEQGERRSGRMSIDATNVGDPVLETISRRVL